MHSSEKFEKRIQLPIIRDQCQGQLTLHSKLKEPIRENPYRPLHIYSVNSLTISSSFFLHPWFDSRLQSIFVKTNYAQNLFLDLNYYLLLTSRYFETWRGNQILLQHARPWFELRQYAIFIHDRSTPQNCPDFYLDDQYVRHVCINKLHFSQN